MEIVKVQTTLASSDPEALALVYDKDRKWLVHQQLDDTTQDAMGTDVKAFFEAEYLSMAGCWKIGKRVNDRDW
ncbi:hypothetical protein CQ14_06925 [Bradyrhizobium lablabi]|uniref:Uncharacterized protein n=1 Tax=Bradyrhizobium lablabi TaxID=722472 RepID=A0A0R3MN57_9BRAD|nr:hypothetical protein [Bradyrhizobium lablabi]KRR21377.1 hypothetical protein CQ14_06925 [Bradyrhizobium lablabi]